MPQQSNYTPARISRDESGAVLILMIFGSIVLLALAGLAIDAGAAYRAQLRTQRATDAAALSGIGYSIQRGQDGMEADLIAQGDDPADPEARRILIQTKADETLRANLAIDDLEPQPCQNSRGESFCSEYDNATRRITVSAEVDVDLLLLDVVPFGLLGLPNVPSTLEVAAVADTERAKANLGLVIDLSGSMSCPADPSQDCSCRYPESGGACGSDGSQLRVDKLVDALMVFVTQFDTTVDEISAVPFNMRGFTLPGGLNDIPQLLLLDNPEAMTCLLTGQDILDCGLAPTDMPGSVTNLCDGLIQSYEDMLFRDIVTKEEISYIVFTDGAPTAGRFLFNSAPSLPANDPYGYSDGTPVNDYIHYTVEWTESDGSGGIDRFNGPSLLVKTQSLEFHHLSPNPPAPDPSLPGRHVPLCHSYEYAGSPSEEFSPSASEDFCKVFDGCLGPASGPSSLEFSLPHAGGSYSASALCNGADVESRETSWKKLYFDCAVAMSDFMRENRGTFYVVGLGMEDTDYSSPYQNLNETTLRKDVLNARIANAPEFAIGRRVAAGESELPEFTYDGYKTYSELNSNASPRTGVYLPTPEPNELRDMFRTVAKRIQLRLTR